MTAATDTGANGGDATRAQQTDPMRPADRCQVSGRPGSASRSEEASHSPVAEWIAVALIPRVAGILCRLQSRKELSKADIVNRAVTLYDFIDAQLDAGRDILIRDNDTQEIQLVMLQ